MNIFFYFEIILMWTPQFLVYHTMP